MKILRIFLIVLAIAAAFGGGYVYRAMKGGAAAPQKAERKVLYWVDPMHPAYKSDKPGIAPDCGMKLEPVYADGAGAPEAAPAAENAEAMPVGTVQISPEKQQLIGVRYGVVESGSATETIRAEGKIAYDETRISHVHTRVEGWVDKVFADFTGQFVRKGQPLLTVYSPEMLATQRELLLAAKAKNLMRDSTFPTAIDNTNALVDAARKRLELWNLSEAQIDEVLRTGKTIQNITVYAPASGYVLERKAFPNQKIMPDTDLYTVADLSRVWILANVFEYEMPNIRLGQAARVTLPYEGGRTLNARVSYIQPQIDPATRTLQIRLEAANPGLMLKPDMYVNVEFQVQASSAVTVPADAVLDAGERKTVFVDRGNGFFEPRQVEVGERVGGRVTILKGLHTGERIVTSGNFLIDSESQMKAAAAGMGGMAGHQHGAGGMSGGQSGSSMAAPKAAAPASGTHKHD